MRRTIAAAFLLVAFAACASQRANVKGDFVKPDIQIVQTSSVPPAARYVQGGLNISYAMRVANRSAEDITLRRVTVESMSEGAYHVGPHSVPFTVAISPGAYQDVEFWAPAYTGQSVTGANGPVVLRVICEFSSDAGKFQHVVTRVVNERTSITGEQ